MKFTVLRAHQGDRWYDEGDTREARKLDVAHLLARGTLGPHNPDAQQKTPAKKAQAKAPANKAQGNAPANKAQGVGGASTVGDA